MALAAGREHGKFLKALGHGGICDNGYASNHSPSNAAAAQVSDRMVHCNQRGGAGRVHGVGWALEIEAKADAVAEHGVAAPGVLIARNQSKIRQHRLVQVREAATDINAGVGAGQF